MLAVAVPFAVPLAVFVFGVFAILVWSTSDDEGLASSLANQTLGGFAALIIFANLVLVLPAAVLISSFLAGLVDRAETRAIERSR